MSYSNAGLAVAFAVVGCALAASGGCGPPKGPHDSEGRFDYPPYVVSSTLAEDSARERQTHALKTVWIIVMENHDWKDIEGSPSAPYINGTLLPRGAHAQRYASPYAIHPSEPNYIWMEAGDDLHIRDNDDPDSNYRTTKNHLTTLLETAEVSWKSYQESIKPDVCPVASFGRYGAKHNPMVFFDDVTDGRNPNSKHCIEHIRPYEEITNDLATGNVARYNFITPNMCSDMHDADDGCETRDSIKNGDLWLSREIPKILASKAYEDGGVVFITWDESETADDAPIGMIVLSKHAKVAYEGHELYSHSSLLRTVQDIFAIKPYLRDAARAKALDDLFVSYP
jgi:phosphatidylinositol-3-phosphatase